MAGIDEFRDYTNTRRRRHTFYCYSTKEFVQDQAIFFVLVEAYRKTRSKRQALFLTDWFVEGNIPDDMQDGGYLTNVNISSELKNKISGETRTTVGNVGLTFADKREKHGFWGAVKLKTFGDTKAPEKLFDTAQIQVAKMLDDRHGFGGVKGAGATYQPDSSYQPNAVFSGQAQILRKHLKTAGFDPDDLGIY